MTDAAADLVSGTPTASSPQNDPHYNGELISNGREAERTVAVDDLSLAILQELWHRTRSIFAMGPSEPLARGASFLMPNPWAPRRSRREWGRRLAHLLERAGARQCAKAVRARAPGLYLLVWDYDRAQVVVRVPWPLAPGGQA